MKEIKLKVVVTGATGGLGRSLCEFLSKKGNVQVSALGRNQEIGSLMKSDTISFFKGDINDVAYLSQAFSDADIVVHTAGLATPWASKEEYQRVNIEGTKSVIKALAGKDHIRLISLSTPSVYFSEQDEENITETKPLPTRYRYHYPSSKKESDQFIISNRPRNSILLRPRAIFGRYDRTILPKILELMKKGYFPLPDSGTALVDFTAVENVNHAIWLIINANRAFQGDIYNITNNEPMQLSALLKLISKNFDVELKTISIPKPLLLSLARMVEGLTKLLGAGEPFISAYGIHSIGTTQTLSIQKIQRELGYKPIITIADALAQIAKH
jgi:nucleoside-diphosphate-sugar epimerase